jgi:hypothetical protein
VKAGVWGFNNSELIKEDYKSLLSAFGIANPEQREIPNSAEIPNRAEVAMDLICGLRC